MLNIISKTIFSSAFKKRHKTLKTDFTRTRKLTFSKTMIFMLNLIKKSLAIEINNFVEYLSPSSVKVCAFTSSAYVQARKKINPAAFIHLSQILVDEFYNDNELGVKLWKGHRILAVDGSTVNLPYSKKVAKKYGYAKNQTGKTNVQGRVSVLYDVHNRMVITASLNPRSSSERTLALEHFKEFKSNDLIIFDRGYFSFAFAKKLLKGNFVFRLKRDLIPVKRFISQKKRTQIVEIHSSKYIYKKKNEQKPEPIKVRLVRVELPSGEIEVLATSLTNARKYPSKMFKSLYFKRWAIETYYDELKNKMKVEHFTGYSEQSILQDFYAALFISNIQSIIVADIEEEIKRKTKNRKYAYKVNTNLSYGFLKNKILNILFLEKDINLVMDELKKLMKNHIVPIRPNRNIKRNKRRRQIVKHQMTKNQRDAI